MSLEGLNKLDLIFNRQRNRKGISDRKKVSAASAYLSVWHHHSNCSELNFKIFWQFLSSSVTRILTKNANIRAVAHQERMNKGFLLNCACENNRNAIIKSKKDPKIALRSTNISCYKRKYFLPDSRPTMIKVEYCPKVGREFINSCGLKAT